MASRLASRATEGSSSLWRVANLPFGDLPSSPAVGPIPVSHCHTRWPVCVDGARFAVVTLRMATSTSMMVGVRRSAVIANHSATHFRSGRHNLITDAVDASYRTSGSQLAKVRLRQTQPGIVCRFQSWAQRARRFSHELIAIEKSGTNCRRFEVVQIRQVDRLSWSRDRSSTFACVRVVHSPVAGSTQLQRDAGLSLHRVRNSSRYWQRRRPLLANGFSTSVEVI